LGIPAGVPLPSGSIGENSGVGQLTADGRQPDPAARGHST